MTRQQALDKLIRAEVHLKSTKRGYVDNPNGPHWRTGMPLLWEVRQGLGSSREGLKLAKAHGVLKDTEHGYQQAPNGPRWREATRLIDQVQESLRVPPVPALGPALSNHKSVLLYAPTHDTDGFDGVWPAFDDTNVRVGSAVLAVERCKVVDHTGSAGGVGFKVLGESGIVWLYLHCDTRPRMGATFDRGEKVSAIARIRPDQGGPHLHLACDTRPLIGRWLKYGRDGNGPDYTYGSPTIGQQLAAALAA